MRFIELNLVNAMTTDCFRVSSNPLALMARPDAVSRLQRCCRTLSRAWRDNVTNPLHRLLDGYEKMWDRRSLSDATRRDLGMH